MSLTKSSPNVKQKGFRNLFRTFGRSSSPLSQSDVPQAPHSPKLPKVRTSVDESAEQNASPLDTQQPTTVQSILAPTIIGTHTVHPQPIPSDTPDLKGAASTAKAHNVAWDGLRKSLETLRDASGVFRPLASVAEILLECFDTIEATARDEQDYEDLATELAVINEAVMQHYKASTSPAMSKCISGVIIGIKHQGLAIKEKKERKTVRQLLLAKEDEEDVLRSYRRIQSLFRQLQANLSMSTWSTVQASSVNERLKGLDPKKEAAYDSALSTSISRRTCTEGTRTEVMSKLNEWLHNLAAPKVYWMNGMAGTGKTTIACTFAERLEQEKLLAASFFCTRTSADCRDATRVIPTIAYQLARYSIPFQSALYEILGEDPDAGSKNIPKQFERLLAGPLKNVEDTIPGDLVVVIDGLDECDNRNEVEALLDTLFRHASDVPLKFFLTSRPEPEIYKRMTAHNRSHAVFHLHDIESSLVQADIALYLQEELASMSLNSTQVNQLAQQSGSLFIYAATLARYIKSGERRSDPHKRLEWVLAMTPEATQRHAQIDALYTAVLQSALDEKEMEKEEMENIRLVLRTVLFAQEPISVETVAVLAGIDSSEQVLPALQPLRSVLHFSEATGLVSTLHASFPDFMFSNERSGMYFCDVIAHSRLLGERCFLVMKDQLRFNICDLESSFMPDDKVENLQDRVKEKISSALAYSCRHWASHLALAPKSDGLVEMAREFLSNRLLFWLEVLSLRRMIVAGIEALLNAKRWLLGGQGVESELALLLEDSRNFLTSYAGSQAVRSTPHIYISTLPFCPRSSLVYRHYWKRMRGLLELRGNLMDVLEAAPLARWDTGADVYCVAYSPDGGRVASGGADHNISIRNAYDGTLLVGPITGHYHWVDSVAFSPDGKLIASGASDCTIRVWNASTGTLITGPLEDSSNRVGSVSFSPDSTRIVSGCKHRTIRVWDVVDGTLLLGPLKGHDDWVYSVAFSPDGTLIASASWDSSVRLWNAQDGTPVAPPFKGHTRTVYSVAFTPDGTRLVSGSEDKTICIWNVSDGSLAASPIHNDAGPVFSVAVSPDGTLVASGSESAVRIWKIKDGSLFASPLVGHGDLLISVAFSPDGTRVIGNLGRRILVWNVREGMLTSLQSTLMDAISGVNSVSFSLNGSSLLSTSGDNLTRIWNLSDGSFTVCPNEVQSLPPSFNRALPDGSQMVSFSAEGMAEIIHSVGGSLAAEPLEIHGSSLSTFLFSRDNNSIILGCTDGTIRVQSLPRRQGITRLLLGHSKSVGSIAQSTDGSLLASYSDDNSIRVWSMFAPSLEIEPQSHPPHKPIPDNISTIYDAWRVEEYGWMTDEDNHLLLWLPSEISSLWKSPYASLIITGSGTLQIPKQKLLVGKQWSKCYIGDQAQAEGSFQ